MMTGNVSGVTEKHNMSDNGTSNNSLTHRKQSSRVNRTVVVKVTCPYLDAARIQPIPSSSMVPWIFPYESSGSCTYSGTLFL